ncbi:MAG: cation-transporting P-type ATPase, partial [Saprospiraceae bacterium]
QGMMKMARHHVIVRKLQAVETLGGTTVICTDKTGTLTQNKMEVAALVTPGGKWNTQENEATPAAECLPPAHYQLMLRIAILCNTAEVDARKGKFKEIGDPLETGLLKFAIRQGEDVHGCRTECPRKEGMPFTSETKIMATLHQTPEGLMVFAKGAAEELIERCDRLLAPGGKVMPLSLESRNTWLAEAEKMAASGLRVIAGAYKPNAKHADNYRDGILAKDLVFAGLFGMIDPPGEGVPAAIRECRDAGIEVVMVTGDHPATAIAIGRQLGLLDPGDDVVILGKDMNSFGHLTKDDKVRWAKTKIFARVSPKQKLDLVKVFQEQGAVVGMTGDGVNDAPALKKADIGIAMGQRGTQVAQEAAGMVLQDDSFASIVVAIRQGRVIFDNIRKFVIYLLSCNLSELAVVAAVSLLFLHFSLQPLQILFINIITDVLPALALGVTSGSPTVMQRKPRDPAEPIIDRQRWRRIFFYAAVLSAATIGAVYFSHYFIQAEEGGDARRCNNVLFFTLIFSQLFHVFNMGSIDAPFFKTEVIRNRYVWYAAGACILIVVLLYQFEAVRAALSVVPMSAADWAVSAGAGLVAMGVIRLGRHLPFFKNEK